MKKFIIEVIIFTILIGLVLWDQTYVSNNLEVYQDKFEAIRENRGLPGGTFKSDGCSLWPQGFFGYSWEDPCIEHDFRYWIGGNKEDRLNADRKLRDDINDILPGMGDVIYLGVRIGGRSLVPFTWGWGYGWDHQ